MSFNLNVMLISYVLDKDDDVIYFMINCLDLYLLSDIELDDVYVKEQLIDVLLF